MILDLFAGAGGWDEGLRTVGRTDVVGIELDRFACATASAAGHARLRADVYGVNPARFHGVEGVIASPPCQPFSTAGNKAGRDDLDDVYDMLHRLASGEDSRADYLMTVVDPKSILLVEPLRYLLLTGARWLLLEQVPSIAPVWEWYAQWLRARGWSVWTGILNAEQYGVPQVRRRAVLMAARDQEVAPPTPTHSRYYSSRPGDIDANVERFVSMAEGIGWGLASRPSFTLCGASSHATGSSEWGGAAVRRSLREAAKSGDPTTWLPYCGRDSDRRTRSGDISIEVHEAGLLQSFRADYPWQGSRSEQFLQVVNAVPPRMAAHIVAALTGAALEAVA